MDFYDKSDNFDIMVSGNLNAQTGSQNGIIDTVTDPFGTDSEGFQEINLRDSAKDVFRNQLNDFCSMFNCSIVNHLCGRGSDADFT